MNQPSEISDIEKALSMLEPEQIAKLLKNIPVNNRAYKIDYSWRMKRLAINDIYFSSATYPHNHDSFEEYATHDEAIRQQVLSGIDL